MPRGLRENGALWREEERAAMPQAAFTLLEVVYSNRGEGRKEASPIWDAHGKSCTQIRTYPWVLLEHQPSCHTDLGVSTEKCVIILKLSSFRVTVSCLQTCNKAGEEEWRQEKGRNKSTAYASCRREKTLLMWGSEEQDLLETTQ